MQQRKAVFLDRDGVINEEMGDYIQQISDFKILPFVPHLLKRLHNLGYIFIVVTNQGGISKGLYTKETLSKMHSLMQQTMLAEGVAFSEIYYCPHHPDQTRCLCRKPERLLVEKGLAKFNLDASQCFFIGDKERDIQCAEAAGVKGYLIEANQNWEFIVESIEKLKSC